MPANAKQPHCLSCHYCPPALAAAAACLARGGTVIYPTSTFFALGTLAAHSEAARLVYRLKGRAPQKPLPLLAANMEQARQAVNLEGVPKKLLELFWPGPLTVLAGAEPAAIRIDAHPLAQSLALLAGGVLTASSANLSGEKPAASLEELSPALLKRLASLGQLGAILPSCAFWQPRGGAPSTIVEVLGETNDNALRVARAGAVKAADLRAAGFEVRKGEAE